MINFDDYRPKFDGLITLDRLYQVGRGLILADDNSDF